MMDYYANQCKSWWTTKQKASEVMCARYGLLFSYNVGFLVK